MKKIGDTTLETKTVYTEKQKNYGDNVLSKDIFDDLLHSPTISQNNTPGELFENQKTESVIPSSKKQPSLSENVTEEEKNGLLGEALFGDSSNVTPTRKPLFNPPSDYVDNDDLNIPAYWTRNKEFGKTIDLTDK